MRPPRYCLTKLGQQMVEDSINLADRYANKFAGRSGAYSYQCREIARTSLIMIAATWQPTRAPWISHLKSKLWYELLSGAKEATRKRQRNREVLPIDFDLSDDGAHSRRLDDGLRFEDMVKLAEPKYRELLTLRFRDGLEVAELARRFGVYHGTIKSRIDSALISIRQNLRHAEKKRAS